MEALIEVIFELPEFFPGSSSLLVNRSLVVVLFFPPSNNTIDMHTCFVQAAATLLLGLGFFFSGLVWYWVQSSIFIFTSLCVLAVWMIPMAVRTPPLPAWLFLVQMRRKLGARGYRHCTPKTTAPESPWACQNFLQN